MLLICGNHASDAWVLRWWVLVVVAPALNEPIVPFVTGWNLCVLHPSTNFISSLSAYSYIHVQMHQGWCKELLYLNGLLKLFTTSLIRLAIMFMAAGLVIQIILAAVFACCIISCIFFQGFAISILSGFSCNWYWGGYGLLSASLPWKLDVEKTILKLLPWHKLFLLSDSKFYVSSFVSFILYLYSCPLEFSLMTNVMM